MAKQHLRRSENIQGNFFVDSTCIDCDTCRWMAPEIFRKEGEQSIVYHQPTSHELELKTIRAMLSCPTFSIGSMEKTNKIKEAQVGFPICIDTNVFHCGYHSENSYGASSYFLQREKGNVLVDSPRFARPLVKRLEEMGGIKYMYLTHRDDVADHKKYQKHFNCKRLIHIDDISYDTKDVEIKLSGNEAIQIEKDLVVIPVPGHTKGHTVLLFRKYLFTGDHLAWSPSRGHLYAFRDACWYSWTEQTMSMYKLLEYDFEWVLPGHGRSYQADIQTMHESLKNCLKWMESKLL
ncbi:MAG: MBL fold metallo-hydrolase [Leptospiraceae bacterium]|nr:MBL fold metallo-hydrolase [Leptospiraceae bacterium]